MEHTLVWLELASDDVAASREFWSALFGWEMLETEAVVSLRVGVADGTGASIKENPGRGHIPSHWAPSIQVEDVKAATEKARRLGATVLDDVHESPQGRGYARTILDPTGAPLSLWQTSDHDAG